MFFRNQEELNLYRYVALVVVLIMFQFVFTGFIAPGNVRGKVFTKQYMEENFTTEHERYFTEGKAKEVPRGGYPDMGSGRYAERLSYKEWYNFNVAQRIHYHFLESVTSVVTWILIAGVRFPIQAISFGAGFSFARLLFHIGYHLKGPSGRTAGFILQLLCSVVLFGFAFASCIDAGVSTNFPSSSAAI